MPESFKQEIIEIGAFMLDDFGTIKSSFNKFVKPKIHPVLSNYCTELTSITQLDVNRANYFDKVVEDFQDWVGIYDDDFVLCSWGSFDKKQLIVDCENIFFDTEWIEENFLNLKYQYNKMKKIKNPLTLKTIVEREGFEWEGERHRAIDDAYNLTKIFRKYIDSWVI